MYNCANVSFCVVTAQCLSVHLCVCECVCQRVRTSVRCRHAPPPPRNPPHCAPLAQEQTQRPGRAGLVSGLQAAVTAARLCPLNRSPSRLQLISHVTFYLLSPGASCPRTVSRSAAPRAAPAGGGVCGSRNFRQSSGWPGRPHGATRRVNVGGSRDFARPGGRR